jgi:hypothetical protein
MMSTTHAAAGVLLATPLAFVAPELATVGALAGVAGGVFPDLDLLYGTHRKTLHYPEYYWLLVVPSLLAAALRPSTLTVANALFWLSAAVHSVADWFGGDTELRPWEGVGDEAVYLHARRRWLPPKRWIRYDGAPEDLLTTLVLSVPGLVLFGDAVRTLTLLGIALGVGYALVRKRLPELEDRLTR